MQSGMEALGQELAKEIRELRTRLGARQLGAERAGDDVCAGTRLGERAIQDLEIETLVQALAVGSRREHQEMIRRVLAELCPDPESIRYRQAIAGDLLRDHKLAFLEELVRGSRRAGDPKPVVSSQFLPWRDSFQPCGQPRPAPRTRPHGLGPQGEAWRVATEKLVTGVLSSV